MNSSTFLMIVGFLLTFGGVGGIENSMTSPELLGSTAVAILGLGTMWCGMRMMQILDNQY